MQRAVARASSATAARSAAPAASCAMAHAGAGATGQHAAHAAALQCRPYACMRGSLQTVRCSHAGFARSREHAWANGHALGHDSHANGATATIINGHAAMEILPTTAASLPQTFQTYDDEDVATHAPRRMHSPAASTSKPALKYETIMLKVSGEALQGSLGFGVDATVMRAVAEEVQRLVHHGVRVAIVVGGGNYFRGANAWQGLERATADYVGMLATVMNALQLQGALEGLGVDTRVQVRRHWVMWWQPVGPGAGAEAGLAQGQVTNWLHQRCGPAQLGFVGCTVDVCSLPYIALMVGWPVPQWASATSAC